MKETFLIRAELLWHFIYTDFFGRYRGSAFGVILSMVNPLISLLIYTFIFGYVFGSRFPGLPEGKGAFALALFSGMIFFNLFSDSVIRASSIIHANKNYATKVVFPLEILPLSLVGSATCTFLVSAVVLIVGLVLLNLLSGVHALLALLWLPPIILISTGVAWLLASFGTFVRDVEAFVPPILLLITFLSAIFYPISAVPENGQWIFELNPFALVAENVRMALLTNNGINFFQLGYCYLISFLFFIAGRFFFLKSKAFFADAV